MRIEALWKENPREKDGSYVVLEEQKTLEVHAYPTWPHIEPFSPLSSLSFSSLTSFLFSFSLSHYLSLSIYLFLSLSSLSSIFHVYSLSPSFSFLGLRQKELSLLRCFSPIYVEYIRRASPFNAVVPFLLYICIYICIQYIYIYMYMYIYIHTRYLHIEFSLYLSIYLSIFTYLYIFIYITYYYIAIRIYIYIYIYTYVYIYIYIFLYVWHCRTWDRFKRNHKVKLANSCAVLELTR